MKRPNLNPWIFLAFLLAFLTLEVAVALHGGAASGFFYTAKMVVGLMFLLSLPLTIHTIIRCLLSEISVWDKAFWSGFIWMTPFIGAVYFLFWRLPGIGGGTDQP